MSDEISLTVTKDDGSVKQERAPMSNIVLHLCAQRLVAVSDNIAQLTRLKVLGLSENAFVEIPSGVLAMTQLDRLHLYSNRLVTIPREIGRFAALIDLALHDIQLAAIPREIGHLFALKWLSLDENALTSLPAELGQLSALERLDLRRNNLTWLPTTLDRLPSTTEISLYGNPLPIEIRRVRSSDNSRPRLLELFAATTWPTIAGIREPALELLIGLEDLSLPALVTLEIIDAAFPNSIPMHLKWDLITAVKHFHERHGIARRGIVIRRRVRRRR